MISSTGLPPVCRVQEDNSERGIFSRTVAFTAPDLAVAANHIRRSFDRIPDASHCRHHQIQLAKQTETRQHPAVPK
jgi:hypothetical protein